MKKFLLSLCIAVITLTAMPSYALNDPNRETESLLRSQLATVRTPADSIRILYDIFDLVPTEEKGKEGRLIYEIAKQTGNDDVRLDICRLLSICYSDDAVLAKIEKEVSRIPKSRNQQETLLFVKMKRISFLSRRISETDRQKEIVKILTEYDNTNPKDKTQQLLELYTLVEFMRNNASGDMLKEYVARMINMANSSDFNLYAIKHLVYSEAAKIYSDALDEQKAIDANRKWLVSLEQLEKSYKDRGRKYRNYDMHRYRCYRRMLRNADALQAGEAEDFYQKCLRLAENNQEIKTDIETNPRLKAYYYMAIGDYNNALPCLKALLPKETSITGKKQLLEMITKAAENTGDDDTKLEALSEYNTILEELERLNASEKYRELQIKYDLQDLKSRNNALELENRTEEIMSARRIMTFVAVAFLILFVILISSMYNWGRFKRNANRMGRVVDNIHRERYRLRDSIYSDYANDIDPMAEEEKLENETWQKRLKRAGNKWGDSSIFMTESIVNDLLFIASTGHANMQKHISMTSVDSIMRRAESKSKKNAEDDARLIVQYPENDFRIETDPECVVDLISHIFDVAIKYSPTSTVELSCAEPQATFVDFLITTKGICGAGPEDAQIFHDMAVSEDMLTRDNSGLYICRMISMLLKCEIIPDNTFTDGARYMLRVPRRIINSMK